MWKTQNVDKQKHSSLLLQPRVHCGAHVYLLHHIAYSSESLNSNLMFGESSAFSILIFFVSLVQPGELQCTTMKPRLRTVGTEKGLRGGDVHGKEG